MSLDPAIVPKKLRKKVFTPRGEGVVGGDEGDEGDGGVQRRRRRRKRSRCHHGGLNKNKKR